MPGNSLLSVVLCCLMATALPRMLEAQSLPGLTISNNQFTYNSPDGLVTGIIRMPAGNGPFPAVLISHGKGGSASGFSLQHANELVTWGFACIGPNYTHEGSSANPPDNEGYCPENSRRARRAIEILASAPSVDITRLAVFGHSMGAFLACGLAGEIPLQVKAACISAGGSAGLSDSAWPSPSLQEVQGITAPFLMFHGTADTTVFPSQSLYLKNLLDGGGVPNKRLLYQEINHDIVSQSVKRSDIHAIMRAWFTAHGVLAFEGNTAPTLDVPSSITVVHGTTSAALPITLGDDQTAAPALVAFTTDDGRLPNSSIVVGGSGMNRTLTFSPPAGQTGTVEVALVVHDGQLSTASFLNVVIENAPVSGVNHRPQCSWIPDQRTQPGVQVTGITFSLSDVETPAQQLEVSASSSNSLVLTNENITVAGSGADRTISLAPASGQSGVTTITVTVSDGEKTSAKAFTLTVAETIPGNTPPVLQALSGDTLPIGAAYGSVPLIIRDTEQSAGTLNVSAISSNTTLVPNSNITLGGQNWGRSLQVVPAAGQTGRAVITLTVSDGGNTGSTAFVLDVVSGDTPPNISELPTCQHGMAGNSSSSISFHLQDAEASTADLLISASSSNAALLPASNLTLSGSGTERLVTLTPVQGQTGATTLTLHVSDGTFMRSKQVLFVVTDPSAPAAQFSRPRGVFILDSGGPATYTTSFGRSISLRDANIRNLDFVDGYTLRVAWSDVESATTPGEYDFFIIRNLLEKLPPGQRLSLIIVPGEPAYIAATEGVQTWSDGGTLRATPWDPYLRQRRRALFEAMAALVNNGVILREDSRLDLLNPYLAGGFTGIRDPNGAALRNLPGYTRQKLLDAVLDELHALQDSFPGKFIQIGFWPIIDHENVDYGGVTASEWLRQRMLDEFDGIQRPRVGFFMENLASKRSGLGSETYTGTPVTGFGSALYASRDEVWNGFQMLGSWVRPFNDNHVSNTFYSSPNDAMEHAFNSYRAEYHEVYIGDIDHPDWQPSLQRWHDFYASEITTNPLSDEDGDTFPIAWENQSGIDPRQPNNSNEDADLDSLPLLLEYAFNRSPNMPDSPSIPVMEISADEITGIDHFYLRFPRRTDAPHLQYLVEVGQLDGPWDSGPGVSQEMGTTPSGDGVTEIVTVRMTPEIRMHDRRFARVAVSPR